MTSRTPAQISSDILAKLAVTIPGLSLEIGTPERKMLDTFAEAISEAQIDNYLTSAQLDIDTKSGTDLDDFVGIFGFGRLQGNYATGIVTFRTTTPATQPVYIPTGVQVSRPASTTDSSLFFASTVSATLPVGASTIDVPVQCSVVGSLGNATANTVTIFAAGTGITSVNNAVAFTGGTDDETDEALRSRFKKTFLRNIAGTEDFYTGIALQATGVNRVKVLGPVTGYTTQVQTGTAGTPVTVLSRNCKFIWPQGVAVALNKDSTDPANPETWFTQDTDYTFPTGFLTTGSITPTASTQNQILDVYYEYCSSNSRNDPYNGKTNKVDIFVDGISALQVTEKVNINTVALNPTIGSQYYYGNFLASPGSYSVTSGMSFQRLGSTPILTWPSTITVGSTVYTLGVNYFGVYDTTNNNGSEREVSGIIWLTTQPANNANAIVTYTYNQIPQLLNAIFKRSKQITTDVLVRSATVKYLSFYFTIMYNSGANISTVNTNVTNAVSLYLTSLGFGAWVQLSDIATVIHNVIGVDNCRYTKTTDTPGFPYTVSEMVNGVSNGVYYTGDFQLSDNTVAALDSLYLIRRSFNNFSN